MAGALAPGAVANLQPQTIMHAKIVLAGMASAALMMTGCLPGTKSGRGFEMPSGNAAQGRVAFVQLKCTSCHRVTGVELPTPLEKPEMVVTLGGTVSKLRTYGELVTAIIHPNERLSPEMVATLPQPVTKSPMKAVNTEMTVAQLIDIVTFLEPTYRELIVSHPGQD